MKHETGVWNVCTNNVTNKLTFREVWHSWHFCTVYNLYATCDENNLNMLLNLLNHM